MATIRSIATYPHTVVGLHDALKTARDAAVGTHHRFVVMETSQTYAVFPDWCVPTCRRVIDNEGATNMKNCACRHHGNDTSRRRTEIVTEVTEESHDKTSSLSYDAAKQSVADIARDALKGLNNG